MTRRNVLGLFSKQPLIVNGKPALHWVFWTSIRNGTGINVSFPLSLQLQLLLSPSNDPLYFDKLAIAAAENLPAQGQTQFLYGPFQVETLLLDLHTIASLSAHLPSTNKTLVIINSGNHRNPSQGFLSYICPKGHVLSDSDIAQALTNLTPPPNTGPWTISYTCSNCPSETYNTELVGS
jgi:hypothetical protein